jgi:hypothetical protein
MDDFLVQNEQQIWQDFRQFLRSGLGREARSGIMAQHLAGYCDFSHLLPLPSDDFWQAIFGQEPFLIWRFLNQFGGNQTAFLIKTGIGLIPGRPPT